MNIKQLLTALPLSLLAACANPTAEQSASAWFGVESSTKNVDTDPCALMIMHVKLDKQDCLMIQQTTQHALEYATDGQMSLWKNPSSGSVGTIVIKATTLENQLPLRTYEMSLQTSKGTYTFEGTARRTLESTWILERFIKTNDKHRNQLHLKATSLKTIQERPLKIPLLFLKMI
ncbi:MAG: hypothetical protein IBJ00_04960 [Alphaproteobacteria bacterium]|nr:hypothetical protein [Alphaproteobacteria bacterium]